MPRRYPMSDLVEMCKVNADKEGDDHITDAKWKSFISLKYGDLFGIVAKTGGQYFQYTASITTTGAAYVDEPTDHYSTVSFDRILDSAGRRSALTEIMAQERAALAGRTGSEATCFTIIDDRIYMYPTPPSGQSYELIYIPQPPNLRNYADAQLVDVVTPDGEEFLMWAVTVLALGKGESDVRLAMNERDAARGRLVEWAADRAINEPRRIYVDNQPSGLDMADGRYR